MRKHLLGLAPIVTSLFVAGCTPLAEKGWFRPSQGSPKVETAPVESDESVSAAESQVPAQWISGVMGWRASQKARAAAELAEKTRSKVVLASDSRRTGSNAAKSTVEKRQIETQKVEKATAAKLTLEKSTIPVPPSTPAADTPSAPPFIAPETKVAVAASVEQDLVEQDLNVQWDSSTEGNAEPVDANLVDNVTPEKTVDGATNERAVVAPAKSAKTEPFVESPSAIMRGSVRRPDASAAQSTRDSNATSGQTTASETSSATEKAMADSRRGEPFVFSDAEFVRDFSSILQAGASKTLEAQQAEEVPPAPAVPGAEAYPDRKVEQKKPEKIDEPVAGNKPANDAEKPESAGIASKDEYFANNANSPPTGMPGADSYPVPYAGDFGYCNGCLAETGLRCGISCGPCGHCQDLEWDDMELIPWESLGQGEYIGPSRAPHVPEYRLRVDDVIDFVYRLTLNKSPFPYKINVGDTLRIESLTAANLQRDLIVQPDGTITVRQLGQIPASGRTVDELRADLDERYKQYVNNPSITVTPLIMNSQLQELRATVDARAGAGGQSRQAKVTPEGTIQLPAIGSVPAQGLTLSELKAEIEQRYNEIVVGLEITPILAQRAPRFIYVTGEVLQPGRYTLEAPTTVIQALALAGNWNVGADLRNVVILRRDENWHLMATKLDLHNALFGKEPCPEGEIWLRDSDIVLLPKSPILWTDNLIEMYFTRGLYGVFPIQYQAVLSSFSKL